MTPLSNCCHAPYGEGSDGTDKIWRLCDKCGHPFDPAKDGWWKEAVARIVHGCSSRGMDHCCSSDYATEREIEDLAMYLVAKSRRRTIEECITEIRRMERELETRDVNTHSIITKLEGMK